MKREIERQKRILERDELKIQEREERQKRRLIEREERQKMREMIKKQKEKRKEFPNQRIKGNKVWNLLGWETPQQEKRRKRRAHLDSVFSN